MWVPMVVCPSYGPEMSCGDSAGMYPDIHQLRAGIGSSTTGTRNQSMREKMNEWSNEWGGGVLKFIIPPSSMLVC